MGLAELIVSYVLILMLNPGPDPRMIPNAFLDVIVRLLCFPVYLLRSLNEHLGPQKGSLPTIAYFLAWLFSGFFWGISVSCILVRWQKGRHFFGT